MSRGTLSGRDRQAFLQTSRNLGLDPYEFGALIHQESGFDPNIVGGDGGNYYGLIQFGKPERTEAGLDPNRIGSYTIADQMPHVEKWLRGRGFKTGMGIDRAYATILAGNPNANMDSQDSFGTSVNSSVPKFVQGGSLNNLARQTIGNIDGYQSMQPQAAPSLNQTQFQGPQAGQAGSLSASDITNLVGGGGKPGKDGNTYNIFVGSPATQTKKSMANQMANSVKSAMMSRIMAEA